MENKEVEINKPLPFNIDGKYYIDERCNGCGECIQFADENITFEQSDVFCYVYKQPSNDSETNSVEEAKKFCPLCAIQIKEN